MSSYKSAQMGVGVIAFALGFIVLTASQASAQVRMVEINETTQEVTVRNFGASNVPIANYFLCLEPGAYRQLSQLTIVGGGDLDLSPGEEVTVVYTFVPAPGGGLGLYLNGNGFGNSANLADYVQYNGTAGFREPLAVTAGIWTAGTFATGASGPYLYNGDGNQNGAAFWAAAAPAVPGLGPWAILVTIGSMILVTAVLMRRRAIGKA